MFNAKNLYLIRIYFKMVFFVSDLTKKEIKSLIIEGWKCDDYKGVCGVASHKGVVNHLSMTGQERLA